MITTTFKLTENELYESLVEISKSKFSVKLLRVIGITLLSLMILLLIFNISNGSFVLSFSFFFPIFLQLFMIFISEITAKLQVPNLLKTKNPLVENMLVNINSNYFTITGESFNIQMSFEKLHSVIETKIFFLLKVSDGSANVIPKRTLTIDDVIQFKKIISAVPGLKVKLNK